jgi:hypothetical protein
MKSGKLSGSDDSEAGISDHSDTYSEAFSRSGYRFKINGEPLASHLILLLADRKLI